MFGYLGSEFSLIPSLTRMAGFSLLACLAVGIAPPALAETSLTTLRHETRELLKEEASLRDESPGSDAAISSLCDLYVILRSDPRYPTSDMLRGDAAKIRRRLISISKRRENQLRRQGVERPPELSSMVDQVIEDWRAEQGDVSIKTPGDRSDREVPSGLAGAPLGGNSWELVELIQRVIAPDLWDVRGGPASAQYFAMRRVLVIRATTDVHEQIRDLLMALR